jgi:hypothetical protein
MPPEPEDPYEALRARIKATQDAVDRLASEAHEARRDEGPGPGPRSDEAHEEIRALVALVELLRDVLPPDLRAQLAELIRQLLILLRAILDWWIARIDPRADDAGEPPVMEDIEVT